MQAALTGRGGGKLQQVRRTRCSLSHATLPPISCRVVSMDLAKGEVVMQRQQCREGREGNEARRFTFDAVYDWTYVLTYILAHTHTHTH